MLEALFEVFYRKDRLHLIQTKVTRIGQSQTSFFNITINIVSCTFYHVIIELSVVFFVSLHPSSMFRRNKACCHREM